MGEAAQGERPIENCFCSDMFIFHHPRFVGSWGWFFFWRNLQGFSAVVSAVFLGGILRHTGKNAHLEGVVLHKSEKSV